VTIFADISSHQEKPPAGVAVDAYAAGGHDRLLIKATEGAGYANPLFARWWLAAGRAGLARGAYHFALPSMAGGAPLPGTTAAGATGSREADHFVAVLRAAGGLSPRDWVCLDIEDRDDRAAAHAVAFCERMVQLGYPTGVVYSYGAYLAETGLTAAVLPAGWRRLHIAHYGPVGDAAVPLPPGWGREMVVARQYTDGARVPGIPGSVDASRVVREWLTEGDDDVNDADIGRIEAALGEVLKERDQVARDQAFWVNPDPASGETPIRQGNVPRIWATTYRKVGRLEALLVQVVGMLAAAYPQAAAALAAPPGTMPDAEAVFAAVGAWTDADLLADVERAAAARRADLPPGETPLT
jgi:lysozyme